MTLSRIYIVQNMGPNIGPKHKCYYITQSSEDRYWESIYFHV